MTQVEQLNIKKTPYLSYCLQPAAKKNGLLCLAKDFFNLSCYQGDNRKPGSDLRETCDHQAADVY